MAPLSARRARTPCTALLRGWENQLMALVAARRGAVRAAIGQDPALAG
jgi:hypothetical protein